MFCRSLHSSFDGLRSKGARGEAVARRAGRSSPHTHPFALSLSKGLRASSRGFDKLSPNGVGVSSTEREAIEHKQSGGDAAGGGLWGRLLGRSS
ncbi:hypothetical protein SAMN02787076_03876 [Rhizobacter sp. OV335]|nr:hypothetical protein SAMN02787076_03876 [Rhizobacter sp. OV335]